MTTALGRFLPYLLGAAFVVEQLLVGGTRLLFALPADVLVGLAAVLSVFLLTKRRPSPDGLCLLAATGFAGYVVGRTLFSPVAYLAWPDAFSAAAALAVYLLVACYLTEPSRRLGLLGMLLVLAGVQLLVGARQFSGGDGFMLVRWPGTVFNFIRPAIYGGRASGLYICPNHLAGYLEIVGCLALSVACWGRVRGWVRVLWAYGALACFAGELLTGSRGGMLSTAAGLAVFGVGSLWRVRAMAPGMFGRTLVIAVAATALLGGTGTTLLLKSQLLKSRAAVTLDTGDIRLRLWPAALRQFGLNPWTGTGGGTYLYHGRQFRDPAVQNDPIHVHNDYLELLGEYGLLGAGALGFFLVAHGRAGVRGFRTLFQGTGGVSNAAALNLGALAGLTCLLVHSALDFNLHIPVNALLAAFVCALLANPGRARFVDGDTWGGVDDPLPRAAGFPGRSRRWWERGPRWLLPVLGATLLATALPRWPGELWAERARVAVRDGQWLEGARLARLGLEAEGNNPDLYFYLGEARFGSGQAAVNPAVARSFYAAAADAYGQGRRLFPQDVRLLVRLGLAQSLVGRHAEAREAMAAALRWDPQSAYVREAHAYTLRQAGRLAEAEEEYQHTAGLLGEPRVFAGLEEVRRARSAANAAQGE